MTDDIGNASPRRSARIAGAFYLLTFITGLPSFFIRNQFGVALGLIAGGCYVVIPRVFVGCYCLLIGYLIFRSTF